MWSFHYQPIWSLAISLLFKRKPARRFTKCCARCWSQFRDVIHSTDFNWSTAKLGPSLLCERTYCVVQLTPLQSSLGTGSNTCNWWNSTCLTNVTVMVLKWWFSQPAAVWNTSFNFAAVDLDHARQWAAAPWKSPRIQFSWKEAKQNLIHW